MNEHDCCIVEEGAGILTGKDEAEIRTNERKATEKKIADWLDKKHYAWHAKQVRDGKYL